MTTPLGKTIMKKTIKQIKSPEWDGLFPSDKRRVVNKLVAANYDVIELRASVMGTNRLAAMIKMRDYYTPCNLGELIRKDTQEKEA